MLADSNKKYLSTDLMREEPVRDGYLSPDVRLLGFRALKRVCTACCDLEECAELFAVSGRLPACLDPNGHHREQIR